MILNNLDPCVAQFPQELVTYGGNGQVFSNWAQVRFCAFWNRKKIKNWSKWEFFFLFLHLFVFALCKIWINNSKTILITLVFIWQLFLNHLRFWFHSFCWRWSTYQRWRRSRPWWCTRVIQRDCSLAPPQHQGLLSPTEW